MPSKVSILTVAGQPGSQFLQPTNTWTTETAQQQNVGQVEQQPRYFDKGGGGPAAAHHQHINQQQQQQQQQQYQQQHQTPQQQTHQQQQESGGFITRIKKILDPLLGTGTEAVHEEGQEGQSAPVQGNVNQPHLVHPQFQGNVNPIPDNIAPANHPQHPPSFTDEQLQWLANQFERGNLQLPDNRLLHLQGQQPPQFQSQGNIPPQLQDVVPQCQQENVPPQQYHHQQQGNILLPPHHHPTPAFTDEQVQWIATQFRRHGKLPTRPRDHEMEFLPLRAPPRERGGERAKMGHSFLVTTLPHHLLSNV